MVYWVSEYIILVEIQLWSSKQSLYSDTDHSHLSLLVAALNTVYQWFELGLHLGLSYSALNTIEENRRGKVEMCRIDVLAKWLDDLEKNRNKQFLQSALQKLYSTTNWVSIQNTHTHTHTCMHALVHAHMHAWMHTHVMCCHVYHWWRKWCIYRYWAELDSHLMLSSAAVSSECLYMK